MKKTLLFILTILFTVSVINAQVSLPYYESFDYADGVELVSSSGNQGDWLSTYTNNSGSDPFVIDAPTWSLPTGLPAAMGRAIEFQGGSDDPVITFAPQGDTGFIYSSFVFNIEEQDDVTDTGGGFIYSFGKVNSNSDGFNYTSAVYIRKIDGSTFNIGVSETNSTSRAVWSSTVFSINTDYFIVISYDIENEISHMWINPASVSATEPAADLTTTDTTTGSRDDIVVVRLSLESNSRTPTTVLDEIRIGKTWESVITNPTASVKDNEVSDYFNIYPNPANGILNIQSKSVEVTKVEMFNVTGQRVLVKDGAVNKGLDVSSLSKGIYVLKISSTDNSFSQKIIIE